MGMGFKRGSEDLREDDWAALANPSTAPLVVWRESKHEYLALLPGILSAYFSTLPWLFLRWVQFFGDKVTRPYRGGGVNLKFGPVTSIFLNGSRFTYLSGEKLLVIVPAEFVRRSVATTPESGIT